MNRIHTPLGTRSTIKSNYSLPRYKKHLNIFTQIFLETKLHHGQWTYKVWKKSYIYSVFRALCAGSKEVQISPLYQYANTMNSMLRTNSAGVLYVEYYLSRITSAIWNSPWLAELTMCHTRNQIYVCWVVIATKYFCGAAWHCWWYTCSWAFYIWSRRGGAIHTE